MVQPQFLFTKFTNYFSVKVQNLESLSVAQIQEIQEFVMIRNGIFDFNSYSFEIQKRLEFNEFQAVVKNSSLNAICTENILKHTQQDRIGFGQYKGLYYHELPDSYMIWLKTNYKGFDREKIQKELQKRGL